ncbi:GNAT family N-acetyltransferase [Aureibacillus halotolerans]|uniref:GNAT family acetyltransferase n=1 Tax=Aureibacillus halotolerans TaxID=1508390 RepID=A0A4R6TQ19_9BACI|nr:GNAT family N-acetyltransferase [Aureibacillus halotolerans]TDQ34589.1 GNAT family acetyltransferase [Aureibacillus halotolerans]
MLKANEADIKEILEGTPQVIHEGTLGHASPSSEKVNTLVLPLLQKGGYYLVEKAGDEVIGWVFLGPRTDSFTDERIGFIYELYVKEEHRGQGLAKQLLDEAIRQLQEQGNKEIRLSVFSGNEAVRLYEQLGFRPHTMTMSLKQ